MSKTNRLKTWIIIPDAHIPFEDKQAFELLLRVGHDIRPHGVAIIGDFGDLLSVSSHPKTPMQLRWSLEEETFEVRRRRQQIDGWKCKEKKFFEGNHCIRGQRLAMQQMVGLYDSLAPDRLYKLSENGWKVFPYRTHSRVGKLHLVHDIGYSGKYAAFSNGDAFGSSTVQGHTHRATVAYFGSVKGEKHVSATLGWVGDPKYATYMSDIKVIRDWMTSFGVAYVEEGIGNTHFQLVPIIEGKCVVNGKLYR